jgi:hypothetical protein
MSARSVTKKRSVTNNDNDPEKREKGKNPTTAKGDWI